MISWAQNSKALSGNPWISATGGAFRAWRGGGVSCEVFSAGSLEGNWSQALGFRV